MVVDPGEAEIGEREPPELATASSGSTMPERTSSSRSRRAASSTSLSWPVVTTVAVHVESRSARPHRLPRAARHLHRAGAAHPARPRAGRARADRVDRRRARGHRSGEVDLGFVPIENSIEGTVNVTLDRLAFDHDLFIQREVVLDVQLNLLAPAGTALADIKRVVSIPVATAQCHEFLSTQLPGVELVAANSTAEAAQWSASRSRLAPRRSDPRSPASSTASRCSPPTSRTTPETRPASWSSPETASHSRPVTTRRRSSCSSGPNAPGSLLSILQEFAARRINLTKLETRPTKKGPRRLLLPHRPRGPHRRRGRRRRLRELHSKQGGREVPRLVPGGRRPRRGRARAGRRCLA